MGSYNLAEVEFDVNTGELNVSSRHKFDVKRQKIIGAVSILLVQADNSQDLDDESRRNSALSSALYGSLSGILDPRSQPKITVPSSLSLIDIPQPVTPDRFQEHGWRKDVIQSNHLGTKSTGNLESSLRQRNQGQSLSGTTMGFQSNSQIPGYEIENTRRSEFLISKNDQDYAATNLTEGSKRFVLPTKSPDVSVIDLTDMSSSSQTEREIKQNATPTEGVNHPRLPRKKQNFSRMQLSQHVDTQKSRATNRPKNPRSNEHPIMIPFDKVRRNAKISDVLGSGKEQTIESKCFVCHEKVSSFMDNKLHCDRHNLAKQCVICGVKLALSSNLNRHFACHIHNVAFTCPFCPAMYRRKDNLTTHLNQKHNMYPWQRRLLQTKKSFLMSTLSKYGRISGSYYGNRKSQSTGLQEDTSTSSSASPSGHNNIQENVTVIESSNIKNTEQCIDTTDQEISNISEVNEVPSNITNLSNSPETNSKLTVDQSKPSHLKDMLSQSTEDTKEVQEAGYEEGMEHSRVTDDDVPSHSIINYSCSACNMRFALLEDLKKHVIQYHSEHVSEGETETLPDSSAESDRKFLAQSTESQDKCDNSHNTSASVMYLDFPQTTDVVYEENSTYTSNTQMGDVIDIEKLGELSSSNFTEITVSKPSQTSPNTSMFAEDSYNSTYTEGVAGSQSSQFQNLVQQAANYHLGTTNVSGIDNAQNVLETSQDSSMDIGIFSPSGRKRKSQNRQCMFCQIELETSDQIVEHANEHADILGKKFVCVTCGTVLSTKDCLRRHAVTHMGVRHACLFCSTAYSRRDNLLKHMRDVHHYQK